MYKSTSDLWPEVSFITKLCLFQGISLTSYPLLLTPSQGISLTPHPSLLTTSQNTPHLSSFLSFDSLPLGGPGWVSLKNRLHRLQHTFFLNQVEVFLHQFGQTLHIVQVLAPNKLGT